MGSVGVVDSVGRVGFAGLAVVWRVCRRIAPACQPQHTIPYELAGMCIGVWGREDAFVSDDVSSFPNRCNSLTRGS